MEESDCAWKNDSEKTNLARCIVPQKRVKPTACWRVGLELVPKVPLAKCSCHIALILEQRRKHLEIERHLNEITHVSREHFGLVGGNARFTVDRQD